MHGLGLAAAAHTGSCLPLRAGVGDGVVRKEWQPWVVSVREGVGVQLPASPAMHKCANSRRARRQASRRAPEANGCRPAAGV